MSQTTIPSRTLSAADSLMWRIEADPVLRSPIVVVALLDRSPKPKRLRATIEQASLVLPGLRHRIVAPPGGLGGRLRWVPDERFSLDHHIRWVGATAGGLRGLLDMAEPDVTVPFDPQRPLWSLTVVEGLDGGRAALVFRLHHCITDGIGGLRFASDIFESSRRGDGDEGGDGEMVTGEEPTMAGSGSLPFGDRLADGIDLLLGGAGAVVAALRDPAGAAAGTVSMARSVGRLLAPHPSGSPLLVRRGLDRRLHLFERPLEGLRAAAGNAGGTINDVLLAAVAGAFRAYHEHHRVTASTMTVIMPMNLRQADEDIGGNRFTPARFVLPVDEVDPVRRIKVTSAITRAWKQEPALGATPTVAEGLNLLPGPVVTRVFGAMLRSADADIVDVPGLRKPVYLGGARIDRMWAFAPPTGAAFSVTLLSHRDVGCIGVCCDRTAVALPELMMSCVESSFDEMLDL